MAEQNGLTALVVDDELDIVEEVAEFLEGIGYHVEKAYSGKEALTYIRSLGSIPLHMILTDVDMLNMRGDQLLKTLVNEGYTIPTIVMSGNPESPQASAALQYARAMYSEGHRAGLEADLDGSFDDFPILIKPLNIKELRKKANLIELLYESSNPA